MLRFYVDESFWELFPEARIGIVVVRNLDNSSLRETIVAPVLQDSIEKALSSLEGDFASHPAVAPWRDAYRRFGAKPSKHRSAIESLLRSVGKGRLKSINPLVDLYNAISLRYLLPCGGEDLRAVHGDVRLTRAVGGEHFVALRASEEDPPRPGEVVYRDDKGVLCRCWNWREAERTKLTHATIDAVLCLEAVTPLEVALEEACEHLATLAKEKLGGRVETKKVLSILEAEATLDSALGA